MYKLRYNTTNLLCLTGVILFLFSDFFRFAIFEQLKLNNIPYLKNINILAIVIILILFITKNIKLKKEHTVLLIFFFACFCVMSFLNGKSQFYLLPLFICNLLIPLGLLSSKYDKLDGEKLYKNFLKFYNIWILSIVLLGIFDYMSSGRINLWLTQNFYPTSMKDLVNSEYNLIYRLSTPWGTSLFNGFLILVYLIINSINYFVFKKKDVYLYFMYIISIIGIILVGSKACLILAILYILITRLLLNKKRKFLNLVIMFLLFVITFNLNFFQDNIWERMINQYETGTLSSGRSYIFSFISSGEIPFPNFFTGQGANYSRVLSSDLSLRYSTATNFEYPVIMFSYDYGILATIIYYYLIFWIPLRKFLKANNYIIAVSIIVLFVYLNSFNGIADLNYDFNYKYVFLTIILYNLNNKNVFKND